MDVVTIKIKITNDELLLEEKTDLIKESLKSVINRLEEFDGMPVMRAKDNDCTIEYVHLVDES